MCEEFERKMRKWATLGGKFLKSARYQAKQIAASGNPGLVVSDHSFSDSEYAQHTEANDYNLAIPTIYNFYHGLELFLKGALSADGSLIKKNHDLDNLFKEFKKIYLKESNLVNLLEGVLSVPAMPENDSIRKFCERNKLSPAKFYEALRYPENRGGDAFKHIDLMHNEIEGVAYFKKMVDFVDRIIPMFVELSRSRTT